MRAEVPTSVVDNSYTVFPEGYYEGAIASAELRDPNNDGSWLVLKVGLNDITPKDGTSLTDRKTFKGDITVRTNGTDLFEMDGFTGDDLPFAIVRSAGVLAGLAEGLGVATRTNGAVNVDLKATAEALIDGQFEGERVSFQVTHYTPKGSDKPRDQYNRFGAAS